MTAEEKKFMEYWERNRDRQKKVLTQWYIGLPAGLIFAIPIAINYSLGWNKRAKMVADAQFNPMVLVVAIMLIITFFAIFTKRYQWEQREQRYRELKASIEQETEK